MSRWLKVGCSLMSQRTTVRRRHNEVKKRQEKTKCKHKRWNTFNGPREVNRYDFKRMHYVKRLVGNVFIEHNSFLPKSRAPV